MQFYVIEIQYGAWMGLALNQMKLTLATQSVDGFPDDDDKSWQWNVEETKILKTTVKEADKQLYITIYISVIYHNSMF